MRRARNSGATLMKLIDVPYKFTTIWGKNATAGFVTSPIPSTTAAPAASQSLGFPPATSQPIAAGGTSPNIDDFNGVYQYITAWLQWQQAGGIIQYDATLQTNIGGYPNGVVIASVAYSGVYWKSTVDDNVSNPDAGGANWISLPIHGVQAFTTNGTFTVPAGVTTIEAEGWGGGGGSGGTINANSGSGGGSAGGYARKRITGLLPGQTIAVTIGAAGLGGNNVTPTNGTDGGTTSFGAYFSATGGLGGNAANGAVASLARPGGVGSGGDINITGGGPSQPFLLSGGIVYGANGGGAAGIPAQTTGWSNTPQNGATGSFPGGGAAAPVNGGVGTPGSAGLVIVRW